MNINLMKKQIEQELEKNKGILRLIPSWVTRKILPPGKRLKLDARDLYIKGGERGPICERWMASTCPADNGDLTVENEGLSFICLDGGKDKILLKHAVEILGDRIIGSDTMEKYGGLISFAKLYDYTCPLPHHVHLQEKDAVRVGVTPKPEAYYYPRQFNFINYGFDYTYFGLEDGTSKEDIKKCLKEWKSTGDTRVLEYSRAYKITPGTGWDIPAGILHAPGSLVTYEPQRVSDAAFFFQSLINDNYMDIDSLYKFAPEDKKEDYDYYIDALDWSANVDPNFKKNHYHEPIPVDDIEFMQGEGYVEKWIAYGSREFSAKELTVFPGQTVKIKDASSYGLLMVEGYGTINGIIAETPVIIRYNDITADEMFVSMEAAREGVTITNHSEFSNLVMLKQFGPDNNAALAFVK